MPDKKKHVVTDEQASKWEKIWEDFLTDEPNCFPTDEVTEITDDFPDK